MIYLLRGAHANEYELQNYAPIAKKFNLRVVTSQHPLTTLTMPSIRLASPADWNFPLKRQILNRLIGGEHWLYGLEPLISNHSNYSNNRSIVHTAETYLPYTHQAVELRKRGLIQKLICTCWETIPHANEKISRLRNWKQAAFQYVDLFHVPTELAKRALIKEGAEPQKIRVIPYGIDLTRFRPHSRPSGVSRKVILTVARLEHEKGMQDIEAVAKLLPHYIFQVVGEGSYHPKGGNIRVKHLSYAQIHRAFQTADLFFLPSRTTHTWEEQYGMALIEAMACGLPIVTTRSGAIPEVVGEAGVLVPEQCPDRMSKAISDLLSDPVHHRNFARLARARALERYDRRQTAASLAQLYC